MNIYIRLVQLLPMDSLDRETYINTTDPISMLNSFCAWKSNSNNSQRLLEHDVAMFITREEVCGDEWPCSAVGAAKLGKVCASGMNCALVQDMGYEGMFTAVHELSHL